MRRWMLVLGAVTAAVIVACLVRSAPPPAAGPGPPAAEPPASAEPRAASPVVAGAPGPGCTLRGRVVDEAGAPVRGAGIRIALKGCSTGADGTFLVTDLAPGRLAVEITAAGYADARIEVRIAVSGITEPPGPVVLRAEPGLTGRVVDADGNPIGGAWVRAAVAGRAAEQVGTDGGGRYLLPALDAREWTISAGHEQYVGEPEVRARTEPGHRTFAPDIVLDRGGVIVAAVTSPEGTPVRGARAKATAERASGEISRAPDSVEFPSGTGPDGSPRVTGLATGKYVLWVVADGHAPFRRAGVEVVAGGSITVDVRLDAGESIRGRILDAAGAVVAGAAVEVEAWTKPWPADPAWRAVPFQHPGASRAVSAGDGTFTLAGLSPGSHRLLVSAEGFAARAVDGVEAGTPDFTIVLERTGSLSGMVTVSETGEPVPLARISLDRQDREVAVSGRDGSFRVEGVTAGEHELDVRAVGFVGARAKVAAEPGRDTGGLDVRLSLGEKLVVLVVRAADGSPVGGAHVFAYGPRNGMMGTDGQGCCVMTGLAAGEYRVAIDADDLAGAVLDGVPVPSDEPLRVALTDGGTLHVRLIDGAGRPVSGRLVLPSWSNSEHCPPSTDEDGQVVFVHVPPGECEVRFEATTTDGSTEWRLARVTVKEDEEVALELLAAGVDPEEEWLEEVWPEEEDPEAPR
ncbi:MAG: carboxypeptidase-like regulatory domain-containing protein [Planctomycetes bacterium]|nr:carboxypeptidase-like regulatory domain-containing protein [Planctomycetota bacterium]